jgi:hypothetical protein
VSEEKKTEGLNRWFRDGYNARMKGTPRANNPRGIKTLTWSRGAVWTVKASRWDEGWEQADNQIRGMTAWDQEQDLINELIGRE